MTLEPDTAPKHEPRTYRRAVEPEGLVSFEVAIKETDLQVSAERDLTGMAEDLIVRARWDLERYIASRPLFAESYVPVEVTADAPEIVRAMAEAARRANVGPMAAVAGAIAEYVARGLSERSAEVIVENGGDIYITGDTDRVISLWAGDSAATGNIGLLVRKGLLPIAVCTSSGTVGHSRSFGRADAVTVLARDGALADAVATALANRVREPEDVAAAIDAARQLTGVLGVVVVLGDRIGAWGNVHLTPIAG